MAAMTAAQIAFHRVTLRCSDGSHDGAAMAALTMEAEVGLGGTGASPDGMLSSVSAVFYRAIARHAASTLKQAH